MARIEMLIGDNDGKVGGWGLKGILGIEENEGTKEVAWVMVRILSFGMCTLALICLCGNLDMISSKSFTSFLHTLIWRASYICFSFSIL